MSGPDRRAVLRRLGAAGLVLGASGALGAIGLLSPGRWRPGRRPAGIRDFRAAGDARGPAILVARGHDPAKIVRAVVAALGGMERFVRPGETVLLKPNIGWDRTVEQAANTHPAIVAEVVRLCRDARAARVIVAEVPVHDAARCAARSGIARAVGEAGGELMLPPSVGFVSAALGGAVLDHWDVLAPLLQADRVINLPIVKDHALTRLTCGMKNWYGLLGGTRARLHQDINHSIADLAFAIRPSLTIVDATRVMMRGGPTGGRLEDVAIVNAVAAGTDPVALDAWGAGLLRVDPADIPYLAFAEGRGLGTVRAGTGHIEEITSGA